jgi:hypothetical protein
MAYEISLASRNAAVNALTALYTTTSKIRVYSNATSKPATPETAVPGGSITLVDVNFAATAFPSASAGSATATGLPGTPLTATIATSGTAGWFRTFNGAGTALGQGTITTTAVGTGDMLFDSTSFVAGGIVNITDFTITVPM